MMRILTVAAAVLVPASAADFWQETKFDKWSEKQVKRMLENSPWARPMSVHGGAGGRPERSGGAMDESPGRPGRGNVKPPEAPPATVAVVRWQSALPVRQAIARSRYGDEVLTSPDAAKLLGPLSPRYIVALVGLPAQAIRKHSRDLKEHIQIKLKSKPAIMAEEVRFDTSGQQGLVNVYCAFPKGLNGSPVIELEDGEVELVLQLDERVSRKFKLKEMVYEGKLEL